MEFCTTIISERLISPAICYGYFPCYSEGNNLLIYNFSANKLLGTFCFPRQKGKSKFCIADYFSPPSSNSPVDFIPMQAVTMGEITSRYSQKLFNENKYSDY